MMIIEFIFEFCWCVLAYSILPTLIIILITKFYVRERQRAIQLAQIVTLVFIMLQMLFYYDIEKIGSTSIFIRLSMDIILKLVSKPAGRYLSQKYVPKKWNHNEVWRVFSITDYAEMIDVVSTCKAVAFLSILIVRCLQSLFETKQDNSWTRFGF